MINSQSETLYLRPLIASDRFLWDAVVQTHLQGNFMQSWGWADFKELEGYQTFRYGLFNELRHLVGGCIFYYYSHQDQPSILNATGGPIIQEYYLELGLKLLIEQGEALAKQHNAILLRIEPLWTEKPTFLQNFVRSPADILPSETILIDLRLSESELLKNMKHKGRYNLKLSYRYGVQTQFRSDSQCIPIFYDLFWQTVKRKQFFGEPYSFFINLCQTLFRVNMAEIGITYYQDQPLSAILVIYYGKTATYLYGGQSLDHRKMMSSYQLHWSAMIRAKQKGYHYYDLYGYTRDPDHGYAQFSQFKRQFGGYPITTIGAQDYFFYDQLAESLIPILDHLHLNSPENLSVDINLENVKALITN